MKINQANFIDASGPTFSSDITIPVQNLPLYLYNYLVSCTNGTINWSTMALKPSTSTTRTMQLQARVFLTGTPPSYQITYTISENDPLYNQYNNDIIYNNSPSGEFSIQGNNNVYNVSDYWTTQHSPNQIILTFTPDNSFNLENNYLFFDMIV